MVHIVNTLNGRAQGSLIEQISVDLLNRKIVEPDRIARASEEAADGVVFFQEEFHQVAANEAGGSRNECFHGVLEAMGGLTFRECSSILK